MLDDGAKERELGSHGNSESKQMPMGKKTNKKKGSLTKGKHSTQNQKKEKTRSPYIPYCQGK